ncbi:MAG TPA: DNA methyltransferase [Dermatophilaceae bacterium]|nr:DNA methyltransferase [Dermatophilaceae bacterium]
MPSLKESLKESAAARAGIERRFGFMPLSVLRLTRGALSRSMFHYSAEHGRNTGQGVDRPKAREAGAPATIKLGGSGPRMHSDGTETFSVMAAELVEFFVKYYAEPGQTYLDPFMGQGVQMQVAHRLGLHYWGFDACAKFVRYIEAVRAKLGPTPTRIEVFHGDSRDPARIPDGIGDFSFHSPPYWDIEHYDDDPAQLGVGKSYEQFLDGMRDVARAWLPKFKPGAWHVVNVSDFRTGGQFYPYHTDTIEVFTRAGWAVHDQWIVEGLIAGLPKVFAADFNTKRIAPRVHEYAIVFRKP